MESDTSMKNTVILAAAGVLVLGGAYVATGSIAAGVALDGIGYVMKRVWQGHDVVRQTENDSLMDKFKSVAPESILTILAAAYFQKENVANLTNINSDYCDAAIKIGIVLATTSLIVKRTGILTLLNINRLPIPDTFSDDAAKHIRRRVDDAVKGSKKFVSKSAELGSEVAKSF